MLEKILQHKEQPSSVHWVPACERPCQVRRSNAELLSEPQLTSRFLLLLHCGTHKCRYNTTQDNSVLTHTQIKKSGWFTVYVKLKAKGLEESFNRDCMWRRIKLHFTSTSLVLSTAVLELMSFHACVTDKQSNLTSYLMRVKWLVSNCLLSLWGVISIFLDINSTTSLRSCLFQTCNFASMILLDMLTQCFPKTEESPALLSVNQGLNPMFPYMNMGILIASSNYVNYYFYLLVDFI